MDGKGAKDGAAGVVDSLRWAEGFEEGEEAGGEEEREQHVGDEDAGEEEDAGGGEDGDGGVKAGARAEGLVGPAMAEQDQQQDGEGLREVVAKVLKPKSL